MAELGYLARAPSQRAGKPPLLLLLHGVGSNERDLFGLATHLDRRFFVASARAPFAVGPEAFAWFQMTFNGDDPVHDPAMAEQSRRAVLSLIAALTAEHGLDPGRAYLGGFSQGAIMTTYVALTQPEAVAGVVAMSGRVLPEALQRRAPDDRLRGLPFLWVHGLADGVLPVRFGRAARDALAALPLDFRYEEFNMAHEVSPASLAAVSAWLSARLDAGSAPRQPPPP